MILKKWLSLACLMALVVWTSFRWATSSAFKSNSFPWKAWLQAVALGLHSISPVAEEVYLTGQLVWPWGECVHAGCLWCVWHSRCKKWVSNMKEPGGITWCGHPWRHLHEGCHWDRDGCICLLRPEGIFCFFSWGYSPQGHWWWLCPRHTMLGDRG